MRVWLVWAAIVAFCAGGVFAESPKVPPPRAPERPTFDGGSDKLKATEIVATLDAPIPEGKNTVWCASFVAAWRTIQDLNKEPVTLDRPSPLASLLNAAPDPWPGILKETTYVGAGWQKSGTFDEIRAGFAKRFPGKPLPEFGEADPTAFVAYAYLEANVKFAIPYFQSRKPLEFTDSMGRKSKLTSFGIRWEDDFAYYKLRRQPRILFQTPREAETRQFVMDLCGDSSPSQIIVARVNRAQTLAATLAAVENMETRFKTDAHQADAETAYLSHFGPNDVLLVPDVYFQVSHRYSDLMGRTVRKGVFKDLTLAVARQDIQFRLSRSGAELMSEAKIEYKPEPARFILDQPFLIVMKKRGEKLPYFAMWVDNPELLSAWEP